MSSGDVIGSWGLQTIWECNGRGEVADLRGGPGGVADAGPAPDRFDPRREETWPDYATIDARALRELILQARRDPRFRQRGIHIRNARITGDLDLYNVKLAFPVRLQNCRLDKWVVLGHARTATFEFGRCYVEKILARQAQIRGDFKFIHSNCAGGVILEGAEISGWVDFSGSELLTKGPGGVPFRHFTDIPDEQKAFFALEDLNALILSLVTIGNELRMYRTLAHGPILMDEMKAGRLSLSRMRACAWPKSEKLDHRNLTGLLKGVERRRDRFHAIRGHGLRVAGNADLTGLRITGKVDLPGAHFGSTLNLIESCIEGLDQRSLLLDGSFIRGNLLFGPRPGRRQQTPRPEEELERCRFTGAIRLRKAQIQGDLNLSNTDIDSDGYTAEFALRATGAEIGGELFADRLQVRGTLDLANATVRQKIRLRECGFLWKIPKKEDRREITSCIEAVHLSVGNDIIFDHVTCLGPVFLQDARIEGDLRLRNSRFDCDRPKQEQHGMEPVFEAIAAQRISVGADIRLDEGARVKGLFALADARISGWLSLRGSRLECVRGEMVEIDPGNIRDEEVEAISARDIHIGHSLNLVDDLEIIGLANFSNAMIENEVRIWSTALTDGKKGACLSLMRAEVRGSVYLGDANSLLDSDEILGRLDRRCDQEHVLAERNVSFVSLGRIVLTAARIGGFLQLQSAHVERRRSETDQDKVFHDLAINARLAIIGRDVYDYRSDSGQDSAGAGAAEEGVPEKYAVTLHGGLSLDNAHVGGNVTLHRLAVTAVGNVCFSGEGFTVRRSLHFGQGFRSSGGIRLRRADVHQVFSSRGTHHGQPALNCESMRVGAAVEFTAPFNAHGTVDFTLAQITRSMRILGAKFVARSAEEAALSIPEIRIGRDLKINNGSEIRGSCDLTGARIENNFNFDIRTFSDLEDGKRKGRLNGNRLSVAGTLEWRGPAVEPDQPAQPGRYQYTVDLSNASVFRLDDDLTAWPARGRLVIDGFRYEYLSEDSAGYREKDRYEWLKRQPNAYLGRNFRPQPFDHLVRVLRDLGHPDKAEFIDVKRQNLSAPWSLRTFILGLTLRHGYQPWRALLFLIAVWAGGWYWYDAVYKATSEETLLPVEFVQSEMMSAPESGTKPCMVPRPEKVIAYGPLAQQDENHPGSIDMAHPPPGYPKFRPWVFSLEAVVPFSELYLAQTDYWMPSTDSKCDGYLLQALQVSQILLGWMLASLFLVSVTGVVRTREGGKP